MSEMRSVCEYCSGNTRMDDYGQCRACGAPKPTIPQMDMTWKYGGVATMASSDPAPVVCMSTSMDMDHLLWK